MRGQRINPNRYTNPGMIQGILQQLRLSWRLIRDPRVPAPLKALIPGLVTLYAVSPVDIVPDFLIGLGQLDDLGIILAGLALFIKLAPRAVVAEHEAAITGRGGAGGGRADFIEVDYTVEDRRQGAR